MGRARGLKDKRPAPAAPAPGRRSQPVSRPSVSNERAANTHAIECAEHKVIDLRLGVIDDEAAAAFTSGQCHAMALALHERTGWPLLGLASDSGEYDHFYVESSDGRALDITGCHDHEEFVEAWGGDPEEVSLGEVEDSWQYGGMREPDLAAARTYVDAVLEYVDDRRPAYCPPGMENAPGGNMRLADVMKVAVGDGSRVPVTPGRLDDAARELFRDHQDHALTRVLNYSATMPKGMGLGALLDDYGQLLHCYAALPDGRALDIDGAHEMEELIARYGGQPEVMNFRRLNELAETAERPESDDTAARTFAAQLLAAL